MTIYGIHAYITLMNWILFYVTLCYNYYMRNHIRHNYPSLIHCLWAFHILFFAYLLFCCYCYNSYKNPKTFTPTKLNMCGWIDNSTANTQEYSLARINKFGLNTLPTKVVVIPYTCGLSGLAWIGGMNTGAETNMEMKARAKGTRTVFLVQISVLWSLLDDLQRHGRNIQDVIS